MKKFLIFTLLSAFLLVNQGCNKENLTGKDSPQKTNPSEATAPNVCRIGQVTDENGKTVNHTPAELSDEMYAAALTKAEQRYVIPVVFHVFGERQGNNDKINIQRIKEVLEWINNDFHGEKNPGDPLTIDNVHADRKPYVGKFTDIEFKLARYDASGKRSNGYILYAADHPAAKSGLGNEPRTGNAQVARIAWDNDRYMNVYIVHDLYANGVTNNSGVSWYPDIYMTSRNTARVVYNGEYLPKTLGTKASSYGPDFTSVITHEFGHFMNLKHAFNEDSWSHTDCNPSAPDGGDEGDYVEDTPQMSCSADAKYAQQYDRFDGKNCVGETIDYGNFMNYGVYCNFTQGQITRMKAALEHNARKPLWQEDNVKKTIGEDYDYVYPDLLISFDTRTVKVGESGNISITVTAEQNVDINVTITNPDKNILSVPETATIPAGQKSVKVQYTGSAAGSVDLSFFGDKADVITPTSIITVTGEVPPPTPPTPPAPDTDPNIQNVLNRKTVVINSDNKMFPLINTGTSVTIYTPTGSVVTDQSNYAGNYDMHALASGSYYYIIKDGNKEYKGTVEIVK